MTLVNYDTRSIIAENVNVSGRDVENLRIAIEEVYGEDNVKFYRAYSAPEIILVAINGVEYNISNFGLKPDGFQFTDSPFRKYCMSRLAERKTADEN
jgi:hypothetical protein